jgi:glutathione-regulated potassium-efflux system ancillary protein KefG
MSSKKILILFAHPLFEKSQIHKILLQHIPDSSKITFHDLYEHYPEFDIDVEAEQKLVEQHDIIIWQHPMYWYSCPPLLKQWIDLVLQYGWAYGTGGKALENKIIFQVLSTGGKKENYCATGKDRFTVVELLEPFHQTAKVCGMHYLPPFVIHGTHNITDDVLLEYANTYKFLLQYIEHKPIDIFAENSFNYLNDWIQTKR